MKLFVISPALARHMGKSLNTIFLHDNESKKSPYCQRRPVYCNMWTNIF